MSVSPLTAPKSSVLAGALIQILILVNNTRTYSWDPFITCTAS